MTNFPAQLASAIQRHPLTVSISLPALASNVATLQRLLPPACRMLAVVKADAYGHGAPAIAHALARLGVPGFGVATVHEGLTLRRHGIRQPILVMGGLLPAVIPDLFQNRLIPVIANRETLGHFIRHLRRSECLSYPVHLKIDTGMGRLGFAPDEALALLDDPDVSSYLHLQGLMTHLADADNPDPTYTQRQLHRFQTVIDRMRKRGVPVPLLHAANSAAIIQHAGAHLTMVRPGIALYGYSPVSLDRLPLPLQPIMTATTSVVHLRTLPPGVPLGYNGAFRTTRPARIAVLPIGYSHGLSRRLGSRGNVLIQGRRVPIVGKICMDMMLVDVTTLPTVELGDPVVILGRQGDEALPATELAEWQDTIPYEVLCAMGSKGHRLYEPLTQQPTNEEPVEPHARVSAATELSFFSR